ncbi:bile acid:sodium symporter family protein, partial [Acinetobacter baumannii]|nr:bile acid:sodium symporter family protein [Acinetobacter baumannii]
MFQKLSEFATKSFLVWMLVAAVIGFIFPQHVATLGKWVPYLLGIVMLGMGLTITPNDFKMVFKAPRAVIIG